MHLLPPFLLSYWFAVPIVILEIAALRVKSFLTEEKNFVGIELLTIKCLTIFAIIEKQKYSLDYIKFHFLNLISNDGIKKKG